MVAWALLGLGGPGPTELVTSAAVVVASLAAAVACAGSAARHRAGTRWAWALLALAATCWLLSGARAALWGRGQARPAPLAADVPSALALVLAVVALVCLLGPALARSARLRTLLDGLLVAGSLLFVAWALAWEQVHRSMADGTGGALSLVHPVGDVVLAALVVLGVVRARPGSGVPWALLGTGLGVLAAVPTAVAHLGGTGAEVPAGLHDAGWVVGFLLVGLAALASARDGADLSATPQPAGWPGIVVPHLPLVLAAVALARLQEGDLSGFLAGNAVVVLLLLLTRQLTSQLEVADLHQELEAKVERRTAHLERDQRRFRSLAQNTSDVLTVVDAQGDIRYQSPSVERVLGYRPDELVGAGLSRLFHPEERVTALAAVRAAPTPPVPARVLEQRLRRRDGTWCPVELTVTNLLGDGAVEGIVVTSRDITARRALESELRHQALHDPLTGLGNRTLLLDRLEHALARTRRNPESLALLLVDLDGFNQVNDSFGLAIGDRVLTEVARRLTDGIRVGDTVARVGGDEFAILLEQANAEVPPLVAQRILYRLRAPVSVDGKNIVIRASLGVVSGSAASHKADNLLRNADLAMHVAKSKGKGIFEVFEPDMQAAAVRRAGLDGELRRAIREGELVVHYQPLVEVSTGKLTGAEALVRWFHPLRGLIPPGDFLPLAEESDLIVSLGRWVLDQSCRETSRVRSMLPVDAPFTMSVNLAVRQLTSPSILEEVKEAIQRNGLEPSSLLLEITEGALMQDAEHILPTLHALKGLGVKLAIDDFGTGWSSLSRLRSFPVDKLKIDRSFVQEVESRDGEAPLVSAIVAMAKSLSLTTVAEGVETPDQLAVLDRLGCEEAQGFLMASLGLASAVEKLLSQGARAPLAPAVEHPGPPIPA